MVTILTGLNRRISKLREQSLRTPYIDPERATLITQFYKSDQARGLSPPVLRAMAFKYYLENKTIGIEDGELIVGEKGRGPRAVPTYPEQCLHSLEDLENLNSMKDNPYIVKDEVKKIYEEKIIPFWKNKDMRSMIFRNMPEAWMKAFKAGVFTEFMEQRAMGHAIMDDKIYKMGLLDFKRKVQERRREIDWLDDPEAWEKDQELLAMEITIDAMINFANRYADLAKRMADEEVDPKRKKELEQIDEVCSWVPAHAPRNFWEALQMYWFIHLGVTSETNVWDSFNPGRIDLWWYPFYKKDLEEGRLTREQAKELLACLWIKIHNQPAPPKVGVTKEQSNTYQDFSTPNLGGVDEYGRPVANELSDLILEVEDELRIMMPNLCIQISEKTPDWLLLKALRIIATGHPKPSIFNTDVIIMEHLRQSKTLKDARLGGPSGCVTIGAFGKETVGLTGYMNWTKILEITLNNGFDPRTRMKVGIETGDPREFKSFEELFEVYKKQLKYFINLKIIGNNIIERLYAKYIPQPFLSLLIDDCIEKGKDYNNGGPRYNTSYIQGTGLGTITDSLVAIKYHIFDRRTFNMNTLLKALSSNFEGEYELLRQILWNKTPKYGNDDDYADEIAIKLVDIYVKLLDGKPNTRGGVYRANLLPTTVHIYFGKVVGATPDGRKASEPVSEGVSPVQGADRKGPTAVIKSVAKWDHVKTGGTLLNMKFSPQTLKTEEDVRKLAHLIRAFFKLGGHHIQFNVVSADTLREAQEEPEKYRNLLVRVAGYSDFFVAIGKDLQDEIISRMEHESI